MSTTFCVRARDNRWISQKLSMEKNTIGNEPYIKEATVLGGFFVLKGYCGRIFIELQGLQERQGQGPACHALDMEKYINFTCRFIMFRNRKLRRAK